MIMMMPIHNHQPATNTLHKLLRSHRPLNAAAAAAAPPCRNESFRRRRRRARWCRRTAVPNPSYTGISIVSYMSHVTRRTSHVTRLTSHVTRHTSHVTRHTSHVTRHTSHVTMRQRQIPLQISRMNSQRRLRFRVRGLWRPRATQPHRSARTLSAAAATATSQ
jgi:hypothetical protein